MIINIFNNDRKVAHGLSDIHGIAYRIIYALATMENIIKISTCTHGRQYFRSNSIARRQPSPLYPLPLQHTLEVSLIISITTGYLLIYPRL